MTHQNIFEDIDPETGAITMNEKIIPREVGTSHLVCPGMRGGKLFQTDAFVPAANDGYDSIRDVAEELGIIRR